MTLRDAIDETPRRDTWQTAIGIVSLFVLTTLTSHYALFLLDLAAVFVASDFHLNDYPSVIHYLDRMRDELLPLWDPSNFSGVSHLGTGILSPFNPLNYLALVFSPAVTFGIQAAFHSVLRGVGMYFLLRCALGHSTAPAALGGVVYQILPIVSRDYLAHYLPQQTFPLSYYPIVAAFILRHAETREWRYAAYAGVTLAIAVLACTPMMLPALGVAALTICIGASAYRRNGPIGSVIVQATRSCSWVLAVAAGASAVLLVPFAQGYAESMRFMYLYDGYIQPSEFLVKGLDGLRFLITAARPNLAGVSVLTMLVALCALVAIARGRRFPAMVCCVYPTLAMLAALVGVSIMLPRAWYALPVVRKIPTWVFLFLLDFAAALMVAVGVECWLGARRGVTLARGTVLALARLYLIWIGAFALIITAALALLPVSQVIALFQPHFAATPSSESGPSATVIRQLFQLHRWGVFYYPETFFFGARAWLVMVLALSQVALAWLCLRHGSTDRAARVGIIALAVVASAGLSLRATGELRQLRGRLYAANDVSRGLTSREPWERVVYLSDTDDYLSNEHQFSHAGPLFHGVAIPNGWSHNAPARVMRLLFASEFDVDLEAVSDGGVVSLPQAAQFREGSGPERTLENERASIVLTRPDSPLLRLFGARFLIAPRKLRLSKLHRVAEAQIALRMSRDDQTVVLYEDPNRLPRAFIVSRCLALSPPEDLAALRSVDPLRVAIVETRADVGSAFRRTSSLPCMEDQAETASEPATITDYRSSKVVIAVRPTRPGLLVLTDTYSRDWRAYVDGKPRPVLPTDIAFRGVEVRPGDRTVEFVFRPAGMYAGLGISIATILTVAAVARRGRVQQYVARTSESRAAAAIAP